MKNMPNSPERQAIIDKAVTILRDDAPWLWGFHPKDYALLHAWLDNVKPNKIANNNLKYQRIDPRRARRSAPRWNRPVLWPLGAARWRLLVAFTAPAVVVYRRRERHGGAA